MASTQHISFFLLMKPLALMSEIARCTPENLTCVEPFSERMFLQSPIMREKRTMSESELVELPQPVSWATGFHWTDPQIYRATVLGKCLKMGYVGSCGPVSYGMLIEPKFCE